MKDETKDIIYMFLDFLDSISKTSRSNRNFINIDNEILKDVKNELFELLKFSQEMQGEKPIDKKTELIGTLPFFLVDENKFPHNKDIAKLAEKSLNFNIPSWDKKSRKEIIGSIVVKIVEDDENKLENFLEPWREFIKESKPNKFEVEGKKNFVNVWLEFFAHYKIK